MEIYGDLQELYSATAKERDELKAHMAVLNESVSCDGCVFKNKRHQKCSCCRRNKNMKDNYCGPMPRGWE